MKLANDALIGIIEILRQGLMEGKDVSELLKALDLEVRDGKLAMSRTGGEWSTQGPDLPETD